MIVDYCKSKSCNNKDAWYTCHKCGMCGRKFENGFLVNGEEFPPEDEWDEDEDWEDEKWND